MTVKVVNGGLAIVTNRLTGGGTEPKYIGHGTGSSGPTVADTTLGSESSDTSGGRVAGTTSRVTTSVTNDTHQVVGTVSCGSTQAITEAATFDASTSGNMMIRAVFAAVNVVNGDSVQYTIQSQFTTS